MPFAGGALTHLDTVAIDVTGKALPGSVAGVNPDPPHAIERAPPGDWDWVDPPRLTMGAAMTLA